MDGLTYTEPTYTDPITSFFNGIFFIIIFILILIFVVLLLVARGFSYLSGSKQETPPAVKESFGPPYPNCKTNGALAMF